MRLPYHQRGNKVDDHISSNMLRPVGKNLFCPGRKKNMFRRFLSSGIPLRPKFNLLLLPMIKRKKGLKEKTRIKKMNDSNSSSLKYLL